MSALTPEEREYVEADIALSMAHYRLRDAAAALGDLDETGALRLRLKVISCHASLMHYSRDCSPLELIDEAAAEVDRERLAKYADARRTEALAAIEGGPK